MATPAPPTPADPVTYHQNRAGRWSFSLTDPAEGETAARSSGMTYAKREGAVRVVNTLRQALAQPLIRQLRDAARAEIVKAREELEAKLKALDDARDEDAKSHTGEVLALRDRHTAELRGLETALVILQRQNRIAWALAWTLAALVGVALVLLKLV